ncbi:hypothetical protein [Arcanobacterium hippocoleae]|uniref:Uncharacterized protein n=1 Tax=Arcanobacterium hippocoleae TaxID=149017 RepID=A0ABU1T285_9ACTO|nr:hypothetical protein [Arcanobacterium hippocoleae]MDR6939371.1 hypothetical protein [Arcanobacterium hippocoleae]
MKLQKITKLAAASICALVLPFSSARIAQADENYNSESVTVADSLTARKAVTIESDTLNQLIEPTTTVAENLAFSFESSVITALPTAQDIAIQTMANDESIELSLPDFGWGGVEDTLPKLINKTQEVLPNPTDNGIQLLWTIKEGKGTEILRIDSEIPQGSKWVIEVDGSLSLVRQSESGVTEVLISSGTPWAIDANGKNLPTHYEIHDGDIFQLVNTDGAVFPIVADPNWAWWGSLALCVADIVTIFVPGTQIIKAAKASKAAAFIAKSPQLKKAIDSLGGLNAAMSKLLGKLRGAKYGQATERAITKILDIGKERFFDILGIGGCYGVYANWGR